MLSVLERLLCRCTHICNYQINRKKKYQASIKYSCNIYSYNYLILTGMDYKSQKTKPQIMFCTQKSFHNRDVQRHIQNYLYK